jgi:hypothetical protein
MLAIPILTSKHAGPTRPGNELSSWLRPRDYVARMTGRTSRDGKEGLWWIRFTA